MSHARYNARIKGSILEKLCEANYARNPKKRLSRCWTFSVENGIRCRWKAFEKNFLYLSLFICLARISSSRKWNSLLFNPLRFKCRNYERESQELAFDFSLSLNHRRFIFHPELTMLQSFINWNDIYKSSAMEKVKVDLDKMVWMFKKKKKNSFVSGDKISRQSFGKIISRSRIFDVSDRCFWRYIPVILFWTVSWNICLRLHSVEICKTFKLSAMQFSSRGYLPDVDVAVTYPSSTLHDRLLFLSLGLLAVRIIDSVCYRVIIYESCPLVVSRFNSWLDSPRLGYSSNYSDWSELRSPVTELRHDRP